ncbi:MAG: glycosyl hydrolase [Saprospiraceae bacterium]
MRSILISLFVLFSSISFTQSNKNKSVSKSSVDQYFKPLKYRSIGPFKGGRSNSSSGVIGDPLTYYMGTTGGGLWKTKDAGQHWNNISDGYFKTGSVGAVTVSESNPNIVYCGMGEHAPRGVMTHHGDGVYKSVDAGKTWKKVGLDKTQHISRIIVHPTNPNIVYVAAQGALYGRTQQRGIYKSINGGKTWKKTLFINDRTGCSDLSIDMNNPHIMYAAMWEHQRVPWQVISGGPGSGLHKSTDGGETWTKMSTGLPKEMGKMGIAVCRSNSDKVYALIESDSKKDLGGLFVSMNAGKNWKRVSDDNRLTQRAWYYIEVFPDPNDENTVYVMSAPALKSIDGGKSWTRITGTHGDFHDLWINPNNSNNLCISNDGGAGISFNQGKTWSRQDNMPTSQFYRISVDNLYPYNIYAGQQDYPSLRVANRQLGSRGITFQSVQNSAGGESAFLAFDPNNPVFVMGGSYLGTINILDTKAKANTKVMAAPIQYLGRDAREMKYLFNWNAPIIWSQHEPNTYYHGAQMLLKTQNNGVTWTEASPDLTRNQDALQGKGGAPYTNEAVGAENYGTLAYVIESPHEKGVIWTGSDDGYVQLTRDNGVSWSNVTPRGLKECLINSIDVSPHDPATAYIATTRYKFNDHSPGLYKTKDYGKTWTNISRGIPQGAFTRVVREDEKVKGLLVAGTESGIYVSWNDGASWSSLQLNLPITPITDIKLKHDDMIVATSGRSFWILDDMEIIRQYKSGVNVMKIYQPSNVVLENHGSPLNGNLPSFKGSTPFVGVNPANGAVIYYELPKLKKSDVVTLEIKNSKGSIVNHFTSVKDSTFKKWAGGHSVPSAISKKKGLNRFVWNLRHPTMTGVKDAYIEAGFAGHKAIPGTYTLTLKHGEKSQTITFEILPNPNYPTTSSDYIEYDNFMTSAEKELRMMHDCIDENKKAMVRISQVVQKIGNVEKHKGVKGTVIALKKKMKDWDEDMVQRMSKAYDDVENFPNKFTAEWLFMINQTQSDIPKVNQPSKDRRAELEAQWKVYKTRWDVLMNTELPAMNKALWDAGIGAI